MTDLDSADAVQRFINENGVEPLRQMLNNGQLAGRRKQYAELGVARHDAMEAQRAQQERDNAGLRAADAAEAQALEARRAADAAVVSADAAVRSLTASEASAKHAKIGWIVAAVSAGISFVSVCIALAALFKS